MRKVKMETLISKSIERAKLILFRPFSLKKWLCLLLIASLAGALGGGANGCGGGSSKRCEKKAEAAQVQTSQEIPSAETLSSEYQFSEEYSPEQPVQSESGRSICPFSQGRAGSVPRAMIAGIFAIIGILLIVPLIFLFTWLSARFKFVWFDAVAENDASIKAPFHEYKREGNSLFKFYLITTGAVILFFALLALWGYLSGQAEGLFGGSFKPSFFQIISAFAFPIVTGILGLIALVILGACIDHFVVSIMVMDRCGFVEGWKKFSAIAKNNLKDIALFFLVMFGLSIAAAILALLIAFVLILAMILAGGAFFGLLYLLVAVALKAKAVFALLAIILGIPAFICMVLLMMSVRLPFAVFFRSLSLYYLTALNCGYVPLPLEENGIVEEMGEA